MLDWDDLKELLVVIGFVLLVLLAVALLFVGVGIGNAHWNCSRWHTVTGEQTKVIAGDCYVRSDTGRWELFSTYVKNHHIDIEGEAP